MSLGIAIVTMIGSISGPIAVGLMAWLLKNAEYRHQIQLKQVEIDLERERRRSRKRAKAIDEKVDVAAKKVKEVKETLDENTSKQDEKLDGLAKVARATHTLVNSNMSNQLKATSVALRRLAEISQNAEDIAAAELAEAAYADHQEKQTAVDGQDGTDAQKQGL